MSELDSAPFYILTEQAVEPRHGRLKPVDQYLSHSLAISISTIPIEPSNNISRSNVKPVCRLLRIKVEAN